GDRESSEETPEKVVAEVLPEEKLVEEELVVREPSTMVEAVVANKLRDASESVQESVQEEIIESIPVMDTVREESAMSPEPIRVAPIAPKL
ncbi:hypothetical protein IR131_01565, partial [Streptococcus acidominimus]|nr:hypothetical protein [Streptococcus acidominimus]